MQNSQENFLENLNKNGLLKNNFFQSGAYNDEIDISGITVDVQKTSTPSPNIYSVSSHPFGNLTTQNAKTQIPNKINNDSKIINGLDTEILSNKKLEKIDDKSLKMKVRIAQLKEQLDQHKELVDAAYLKSDRNHYQKLQEIQERMEAELQRLVADYQNRQLKSIVFSPFTKLFNLIKSYVALK